jgi:phosphoribosylformylglycinamidine synthase subunit PurS
MADTDRGAAGMIRAHVLVRPKAGILDPQGQAVERALPALGFSGVRNVRIGRLIELDVEDLAQLPEMCQRLLTNPLIEDYEIVEFPGGNSIGSSAGAVKSAGADSIGSSAGAELPGGPALSGGAALSDGAGLTGDGESPAGAGAGS